MCRHVQTMPARALTPVKTCPSHLLPVQYVFFVTHWAGCLIWFIARSEQFAVNGSWVGRHAERFLGKGMPTRCVIPNDSMVCDVTVTVQATIAQLSRTYSLHVGQIACRGSSLPAHLQRCCSIAAQLHLRPGPLQQTLSDNACPTIWSAILACPPCLPTLPVNLAC